MKSKFFDCVQIKKHRAKLVIELLERKSFEKQLKYFWKGTQDLKKPQTHAREKEMQPA